MERYRARQTPARQHLRTNGTTAEAVLWSRLKSRRLEGRRFRRQYGVGPYIVDFCCPTEQLAVELDGAPHFTPEGRAYDAVRTAALEAEGLRVVRFENRLVFEDIEAVLVAIASHFDPSRPEPPRPTAPPV